MKRYPKRARPLWGRRREITGAPIRWTGLTFSFGGPVRHVGSIGARAVRFDSPGGPVDELQAFLERTPAPWDHPGHKVRTINEVRADLGLPGIAAPLGESTIDALSRAISEGLQSKSEHEVTVTVTVAGDMIHASAEYVPSHIERVQFFEALPEMTIDPGAVLVLPPCEIKVDT